MSQDQFDQLVRVRLDFVHAGEQCRHYAFIPRYRVTACFDEPENHITFDDVPVWQDPEELQANRQGYENGGSARKLRVKLNQGDEWLPVVQQLSAVQAIVSQDLLCISMRCAPSWSRLSQKIAT